MTVMDVDATAIPDMIEAQLTLSYSRLTQLIRLIVDQGNGHDMDIGKIMNRLDALAKENAELRKRVDELTETTMRCGGVNEQVAVLKREVAIVQELCTENTKRLTSSEGINERRFVKLEEAVSTVSDTGTTETQRLDGCITELRSENLEMKKDVGCLNDFVALWDGHVEKIRALTTRDSEGNLQHAAHERARYLHSLPPFTKLFEELEVMRQLNRHQTTDSLAAKGVVGVLRRSSAGDIAGNTDPAPKSPCVATPAAETESLERINATIAQLDKRLKALETERAERGNEAHGAAAYSSQFFMEKDSRNAVPPLVEGFIPSRAVLTDIEDRLCYLEAALKTGNTLPSSRRVPRLPERDLPPIVGAPHPPGAAPLQGEAGGEPSTSTSKERQASERAASNGTSNGIPPPIQGHRGCDVSNPSAGNSSSAGVSQGRHAVDDGSVLRQRVDKLEERASVLEKKKADRREVQQLEEFVEELARRSLGPLQTGPVPSNMQENAQLGYSDDVLGMGRGSRKVGTAPLMRSVFVVGMGTQLNDSTGSKTSATVANPRQL
ncbi:hypothetical protein DPX39_030049600 [Trypanosoma brucei equiperdum]|uniref:Uncharacterized protein n=1 Tax=Trypanosoma brucei equiperdum TaxID=630700 RepID=A0A3L6LBC4_9TRYP|nr:hypothetical protein DPX39_030049600 [Trypanosoma brucei equiperdum]